MENFEVGQNRSCLIYYNRQKILQFLVEKKHKLNTFNLTSTLRPIV